MIVSKDINPERDYYYLGAKVIEIISNSEDNIDFFEVFDELNTSENISINLFALTLDWLYLVGAIDNSEKGSIVKCF